MKKFIQLLLFFIFASFQDLMHAMGHRNTSADLNLLESVFYVNLKNNVENVDKDHLAIFTNNLDVFIDDKFKALNLVQNELYAAYKPHFCKLIKTYMERDLDKKSKYEEILRKMSCAL